VALYLKLRKSFFDYEFPDNGKYASAFPTRLASGNGVSTRFMQLECTLAKLDFIHTQAAIALPAPIAYAQTYVFQELGLFQCHPNQLKCKKFQLRVGTFYP
jgi:hypothetical protein